MKFILILSSFLFLTFTHAQMRKGMNYFKIGGMALNQEANLLDTYPPFVDSTSTDTTALGGSANGNFTLGYRIGVANNFSIGLEGRILASKESSFGITAGGLSLRYHFGLGSIGAKQDKAGNKKEHFMYPKYGEVARNFFFFDVTGLYGNMKYNNQKEDYINIMAQLGGSIRVPTATKRVIRHFGLEMSAGASYRSTIGGNFGLFPVITGGIQIYLDKKYIRSNKIQN